MHARAERFANATPAVVRFESLEPRVVFRVEGVDVSVFQGAINWQQLRDNNKQFAFVRSSRTNLDLDPNFNANMAGAKAAGVITGPYQRVLPLGEADGGTYTDPITDARRFFAAAGEYMTEGHLRPVMDVEDGHTLGREVLSQWVMDFSMELERLSGIEPIIYANGNYARNFLTEAVAQRHDLWLARWNNGNNPSTFDPQTAQPQVPAGWENVYGVWNQPVGGPPSHNVWDFWQYTSNGDGLALGVSSARLDLDVFNGDLETMKRLFVIGHQWSYHNTPFAVGPGIVTTIQAEDYDMGGQNYAFNDTTPNWNTGGAYRNGSVHGGVDVRRIANTTDQYRLDDARAGEWVEYTIDVQQDGYYKVDFRLAQADPGARMTLAVDGVRTSVVDVPDTDSFDVFTTRTRTVGLSAGKHVLRLEFNRPAGNAQVAAVDWLRLSLGAATTNIAAAAGSYVRNGSFADQNFGNDTAVLAKRSANVGNTREAYLQFDLSSVSSVNAGWLRLSGSLSRTSDPSVVTNLLSAADQGWNEAALTWNTKPAAGSAPLGSFTVSGTNQWRYEIDLSSFLQSELTAGRRVVTVVLSNPIVSDAWTIFGSDESITPPTLVVT
ncbi:MAG TPA: GH25 family lysozyme [Tepidisphaeraceae bacterium]|nr:GH25 family lysozyme [Tepidisphaeraceae bacterium]